MNSIERWLVSFSPFIIISILVVAFLPSWTVRELLEQYTNGSIDGPSRVITTSWLIGFGSTVGSAILGFFISNRLDQPANNKTDVIVCDACCGLGEIEGSSGDFKTCKDCNGIGEI